MLVHKKWERPRVQNQADLESSLCSDLSNCVTWVNHVTLSSGFLMYKMGMMMITPWGCWEGCMRQNLTSRTKRPFIPNKPSNLVWSKKLSECYLLLHTSSMTRGGGKGGGEGPWPPEVHGWVQDVVSQSGCLSTQSRQLSEPTWGAVTPWPSPVQVIVSTGPDTPFYIFQQLKGKLSKP